MTTSAAYSIALAQLLPQLASVCGDVMVNGVSSDSRTVKFGDLFVAFPGARSDGRAFISNAIASGAVAIAYEAKDQFVPAGISSDNVRLLPVENLAAEVSAIAARFYAAPSMALSVIGVTGTNGKTSCTHYIWQLLRAMSVNAALVGTLGARIAGDYLESGYTTPDAIAVQRTLAAMRDGQVSHVAMEVSSHALDQHRVADVRFAAALFTNLTHDHLDYHGDMQRYGLAKARLFAMQGLKAAIVNADDPFAGAMLKRAEPGVKLIRYSMDPAKLDRSELCVTRVAWSAQGFVADIKSSWGDARIEAPLLGDFNLSNVLGAIGVLCALGFDFATVCAHAIALEPVPGRMQLVAAESGPTVLVDYAHTPDAMETVLKAARRHCTGELWCVFGCGGDRDRSKRPRMGEIAENFADRVVVTSDNPRSEDAQQIIADIRAGIRNQAACQFETDRKTAIRFAIKAARTGDVVVLAGKGHETYQEIAGVRHPFDDRVEARAALKLRGAA
jgi:UDP-N-acetylmuramoyl-L-alanyl-D-glutamate--2,6-diaminopimelate ligase